MESMVDVAISRYKVVSAEKAGGATYTPKILADFVAERILQATTVEAKTLAPVRLLDPAAGDGELLLSLLEQLNHQGVTAVEVHGFETDIRALNIATARIKLHFPKADLRLVHGNFLEFVLDQARPYDSGGLFEQRTGPTYDLIIANPPYVRTQIMGAEQAQLLASQFGLAGRVDLYHAFILGIAHVLEPGGLAGIIVSNRFMTTKSGGAVREAIREHFNIRHVWDLGDTKIFDAAVLPAVLLVEKQTGQQQTVAGFTSIYATTDQATARANNVIDALRCDGVVGIDDGRHFVVQNGSLDIRIAADAVWRVATVASDVWLATVEAHTWRRFGDVGKIRVGVKTCADKVFIRSDWDTMPAETRPELLRSLTTHHMARRFRAGPAKKTRRILYPHECVDGRRRAVDLTTAPNAKAYLEQHRETLQGRTYVIECGRQWYEIWVPQDPASWDGPKLVFRDISEVPTFWLDLDGTIVNGDCYWLVPEQPQDVELLWLAAAVANSTFIESFYDHSFNNKLYAGRRRFITQYVERFPLPDPASPRSHNIIALAKQIYELADGPDNAALTEKLDQLVWQAFGLDAKKAAR